ncbi:bacteriocin biosynthesis cyclodehydratase domain-containing protein [Okibacterium sp. HSC-33S16]|nr:bacteriocin biosynthesis cyclodehydratase domain-containing protein [Okibacterium sp. HSC-33S16]
MFLRLDPHYPVVWRDTTSIQIGAETPVATLVDVSRPFEQIIGALMAGVSREELDRLALKVGLPPGELPEFLERISPALSPEPFRSSDGACVVEGTGPTAQLVRDLLASAGFTSTASTNAGFSNAGYANTGYANAGSAHADAFRPRRPRLAILVANHVLEPSRYIRWLSRDIPHLAVVYTDTGVRIGPLVEPGVGPCLHCLARWTADRDPAWPAIASQLLGQGAVSEREPLVSTVAGLAVRLVEARLRNGSSDLAFASVSFDANSLTGRRVEHRQHPDCGCRSLSGTETVPEAETRGPTAPPMTGRAATALG